MDEELDSEDFWHRHPQAVARLVRPQLRHQFKPKIPWIETELDWNLANDVAHACSVVLDRQLDYGGGRGSRPGVQLVTTPESYLFGTTKNATCIEAAVLLASLASTARTHVSLVLLKAERSRHVFVWFRRQREHGESPVDSDADGILRRMEATDSVVVDPQSLLRQPSQVAGTSTLGANVDGEEIGRVSNALLRSLRAPQPDFVVHCAVAVGLVQPLKVFDHKAGHLPLPLTELDDAWLRRFEQAARREAAGSLRQLEVFDDLGAGSTTINARVQAFAKLAPWHDAIAAQCDALRERLQKRHGALPDDVIARAPSARTVDVDSAAAMAAALRRRANPEDRSLAAEYERLARALRHPRLASVMLLVGDRGAGKTTATATCLELLDGIVVKLPKGLPRSIQSVVDSICHTLRVVPGSPIELWRDCATRNLRILALVDDADQDTSRAAVEAFENLALQLHEDRAPIKWVLATSSGRLYRFESSATIQALSIPAADASYPWAPTLVDACGVNAGLLDVDAVNDAEGLGYTLLGATHSHALGEMPERERALLNNPLIARLVAKSTIATSDALARVNMLGAVRDYWQHVAASRPRSSAPSHIDDLGRYAGQIAVAAARANEPWPWKQESSTPSTMDDELVDAGVVKRDDGHRVLRLAPLWFWFAARPLCEEAVTAARKKQRTLAKTKQKTVADKRRAAKQILDHWTLTQPHAHEILNLCFLHCEDDGGGAAARALLDECPATAVSVPAAIAQAIIHARTTAYAAELTALLTRPAVRDGEVADATTSARLLAAARATRLSRVQAAMCLGSIFRDARYLPVDDGSDEDSRESLDRERVPRTHGERSLSIALDLIDKSTAHDLPEVLREMVLCEKLGIEHKLAAAGARVLCEGLAPDVRAWRREDLDVIAKRFLIDSRPSVPEERPEPSLRSFRQLIIERVAHEIASRNGARAFFDLLDAGWFREEAEYAYDAKRGSHLGFGRYYREAPQEARAEYERVVSVLIRERSGMNHRHALFLIKHSVAWGHAGTRDAGAHRQLRLPLYRLLEMLRAERRLPEHLAADADHMLRLGHRNSHD